MSGPKVVRVVTREELVARSQQLLARLDRNLQLWMAQCAVFGQFTDEETAAASGRRDAIAKLLAEGKFSDLARKARSEIEFLESDLDRRRAVAAEAHAKRLTRSLRARENARVLLKALEEKNPSVPERVVASLRSLANGTTEADEADRVLAQGYGLLASPSSQRELTTSQGELAARLGKGEADASFEEWKEARRPLELDGPRIDAITRGLADLQVLGDVEHVRTFSERLEAIRRLDAGPIREMRVDSLAIDLVSVVSHANARSVAVREAEDLIAALESGCAEESVQARLALAEVIRGADLAALRHVIQTSSQFLEAATKRKAAASRRTAVLRALAKMEYTVNEGMATALSEDGRVVVQNPGLAGYAVELAGSADFEKMQVRVVALSPDRDPSRDQDAETRWCSDFSKLKQQLAATGDELAIERAMPVGATPLRVVAIEATKRPLAQGSSRSRGAS